MTLRREDSEVKGTARDRLGAERNQDRERDGCFEAGKESHSEGEGETK